MKPFLPIVLILFTGCSGPEAFDQPLLQFDFEGALKGTEKRLLEDDHLEIVEGKGVEESKALKATYEGYDRGSMRMVENIKLPKPCREATLNYAVKFAQDFDFAISGKLHGLAPVDKVTGGNPMTPEGWSARLNFNGNSIKSYIYHQNKPGKYGDSKNAEDFQFQKGQYYELAIYVKVNDPPEAKNGTVEIYADGALVVENDSLQLRAAGGENTLINNFLFSTFHGGSSPKFAPRDSAGNYSTETAWFDNFEVYEGKFVRANN